MIVDYYISGTQFRGEFRDWSHFKAFKNVEAGYRRVVYGEKEAMTTTPPSAGPAEVRRHTDLWRLGAYAPIGVDAMVLASDYDTLAARCASQERELAELRVPVERDKYLCRLLVEWYVRVNDGEDHAAPAEHILRGLIRYADERQQAVAERDARIATLIAEVMHYTAGTPHPAEQSLAAMREYANRLESQFTALAGVVSDAELDRARKTIAAERICCFPSKEPT